MSGKRSPGPKRRRPSDERARDILRALMADRGGLSVHDVSERAETTGHPDRGVSERTVYRVLKDGFVPDVASQFEIAATFPAETAIGHLLPSHIWNRVLLPAPTRTSMMSSPPSGRWGWSHDPPPATSP